jgi:hypothetical protein
MGVMGIPKDLWNPLFGHRRTYMNDPSTSAYTEYSQLNYDHDGGERFDERIVYRVWD